MSDRNPVLGKDLRPTESPYWGKISVRRKVFTRWTFVSDIKQNHSELLFHYGLYKKGGFI